MTVTREDRSSGRPRLALGLMSGTSLDGIDAALLTTDGATVAAAGASLTAPYTPALRERLRASLGRETADGELVRALTEAHAGAVADLLRRAGISARDVDVIGFHGHTILHRPAERRTVQIGDGALLSALTGIDVVAEFRVADVAAGGEGAPFAPLYHAALCRDMAKPVCVLNVGGVANLTWIGADDDPLAFDTGPGNALLDDWVRRHAGKAFDADGAMAKAGQCDEAALERLLAHPYFDRPPPKSLDRLDFDSALLASLSAADGAATLTAFTARAVGRARDWLPAPPLRWLVTGGGRRNPVMMAALAACLAVPVAPAEAAGWNGDALEAQAFAFLAVRSLCGLPLSLPSTTGVPRPMQGGVLFRA